MLRSWISFLLLGLGAAASAVVLPRQYDYPDDEPLTAESCIRQSFSNPGWYILGPEVVVIDGLTGGSKGDLGFLALNRATRETARCVATNIDLDPKGAASLDVWHGCNVTGIEFQFELNGAVLGDLELHVRGRWVCAKGSPILFASNGTWEVPTIQGCWDDQRSRGLERTCVMGNSQVSGSLSSPVQIAPQLPLLPYTPWEPPFRCVDRSVDPEWTVEHFSYRHSSASAGSTGQYELSLNLTSISTNESVACTASADDKEEGGRQAAPWIKCTPSKAGTLIDLTEVAFDREYGVLGVRQTWRCLDGFAGVDFDSYTGTGYLHAPLTCSAPAKGDALPSYSCGLAPAPGPIRFSGYWPKPPPMPHTTYSRSCTIGSFVNTTSLKLREYKIQTIVGADNRTQLVGTFEIQNPGSGDTYRFDRMPITADTGVWGGCRAGSGAPLPWQLAGCQYSLERSSNRIGLRFQWYCDDRDPSHAILFDATAIQTLPQEVCTVPVGGGSVKQECTLGADVGDVSLVVENLSWQATSRPMDRGPTLPWI